MKTRRPCAAPIAQPDHISSYFRREAVPLTIVTVSGLIYNVGLTAGPYFEGQLAQKLYEIIGGTAAFSEMLLLALFYVAIITLVQGMRCLKRFYVRRFANNTARNMRHILYHHLVREPKAELEKESVGTLMTKAVADVDACAEGMRKFTTEVFDTGIALLAYLVMLFYYDWRLTLLSCAFAPAAYLFAGRMKKTIFRYHTAYKKSAGALNDATMERVSGAMLYRVFSAEENRNAAYEAQLQKYERAAILANIWENTLRPIYNLISMTGVVLILWFGGKNVLGTGYCTWDIAAFTTFLSCFAKMAIKSSKAAKLFNAVQKAQVSWKRIKQLLQPEKPQSCAADAVRGTLTVRNLSFGYIPDKPVFSELSFTARPGEIIGVTGPVACGKTALGRAFLCEQPYGGSIQIGARELSELTDSERNESVAYLGHQPELMSDTIENNIRFGEQKDIAPYLSAVCFDREVAQMPNAAKTVVGSGGIRLSGGQQARLALARTIYHERGLLVLDDPFSAVDAATEWEIFANLKQIAPHAVILILSHRVALFPAFDRVIWLENGSAAVGTHTELLQTQPHYAAIVAAQKGGAVDETES